jgi:quercetin dioxygenase-like cupin family protein
MACTKIDEYEQNHIPKTDEAYIQRLSPDEEKDFIVRKISLKNNGMMPNHINKIAHQQVALKGEAKVVIGDKEFHAKAGDFLYIPAGVAHYYEACYGSDYEFLCMITTAEDEITFLDEE